MPFSSLSLADERGRRFENIELVVVHAHHIRLHHLIEATLIRQAFIEVGVVISADVEWLPEGMLS